MTKGQSRPDTAQNQALGTKNPAFRFRKQGLMDLISVPEGVFFVPEGRFWTRSGPNASHYLVRTIRDSEKNRPSWRRAIAEKSAKPGHVHPEGRHEPFAQARPTTKPKDSIASSFGSSKGMAAKEWGYFASYTVMPLA